MQPSDSAPDPGRCPWAGTEPLYMAYHDTEWGVPQRDTRVLFEFLVLEGMQAGLSWWTILQKRAHMHTVFHGFDPALLARTGQREINRWLQDPGIIRHRGKLEAMVNNARLCSEEADFAALIWRYVDHTPVQNRWRSIKQVPPETDLSKQMAKDLKKRGYRFVGSTTCYAFMQAVGMVNDHLLSCPRHAACAAVR